MQRVLNELNRIDDEITVAILESEVAPDAAELPARFVEPTRTIYTGRLLEINLRLKADLYRSADQRDDLKPPSEFGRTRTEVEEVLEAGTCVLARGRMDLSEVDAESDGREPLQFYYLVPGSDENPTGWRLAAVISPNDRTTPDGEVRDVTADDLAEFWPEGCP